MCKIKISSLRGINNVMWFASTSDFKEADENILKETNISCI